MGILSHDTTELDDELRAVRAELADTQARLQELLYVASHDLTEPVRMVRSFLGLLAKHSADDLDDRGQEFLRYATLGAERLEALTGDLLGLSRLETTETDVHDVAVADVVEQALGGLAHLIEAEGAAVVVVEPLPVVRADRGLLSLLLQNLLVNAMRFHPEGRGNRVEVTAEQTPSGWAIHVADDGVGIDPRDRERIFQPFQRLHGRDAYEGNGIGLTICRRIARRHGGDVTVAGRPDGGTVFTVTLPEDPADA